MSRPTAGAERLVVLGGFPAVAPRLGRAVPWVLVGATVLVQIVYPLMPDALRTEITVASVLVFCAAALADAGRVHGLRGAAVLLAVAGGGGLLVEAVGVHTGMPFGAYAYTGDLGAEVLGVPAVVPLAWTMMAWPALVVARVLVPDPRGWAGRLATVGVAAWALTAWDVFLDPQMVDAGHWTWAHPDPGLPLVPGVPLTNYGGWLLVSVVMIGALDRLLPRHTAP
ncbi:MAG TPA: carotenoid biosynthesis protein, partial [Pseudonocardia sp.]|nr:carotenoid biosynthesis protein [Pseudonocardia sp.]